MPHASLEQRRSCGQHFIHGRRRRRLCFAAMARGLVKSSWLTAAHDTACLDADDWHGTDMVGKAAAVGDRQNHGHCVMNTAHGKTKNRWKVSPEPGFPPYSTILLVLPTNTCNGPCKGGRGRQPRTTQGHHPPQTFQSPLTRALFVLALQLAGTSAWRLTTARSARAR